MVCNNCIDSYNYNYYPVASIFYTSYKELVNGSCLTSTGLGSCDKLPSKLPDCVFVCVFCVYMYVVVNHTLQFPLNSIIMYNNYTHTYTLASLASL